MKIKIENDIKYAQKIIEGHGLKLDFKQPFHNNSFIYKTSNENISDYFNYLENKNKTLEVIGSGDQILNSILGNSFNIDAFDISTFPKYFLNLKIAAIKSLSKDDFIKFFIEEVFDNSELYDDLYNIIKNNLNGIDRIFWDKLFDFYDWNEIYNSMLFSSEPYNEEQVIKRNKYLQENNYNELQKKIDERNLKIYTGNIFELITKLYDNYDLVNMSNIINYMDCSEYIELLRKIPLSDDGLILTYLHNSMYEYKTKIKNSNIEFQNLSNDVNGLMIYKKHKI